MPGLSESVDRATKANVSEFALIYTYLHGLAYEQSHK